MSDIAIKAPQAGSLFSRHFAKRSARRGEQFGAPGQGRAGAIAAGTVVFTMALWVLVTSSTGRCRRWPTCRWSPSGSASASSPSPT